ncbi:MAG: DUF58 domain-containing protein, partial [Actinobacteria bacterium]|nr:DUF58 domain-containing protein [Actinomycetota bacterium]
MEGWRPTPALVRSSVAGVGLATLAVLVRRPDLLVIAAPLLLISFWSVERRPQRDPVVDERLGQHVLREGQAIEWMVTLDEPGDARIETVAVLFGAPPSTTLVPASGVVVADADQGRTSARVVMRSIRWGRREVVPPQVVATSAWAAFRWSDGRR